MFYGHILRFIPQDQRAPVCACVRARVPVHNSVRGRIVPPAWANLEFLLADYWCAFGYHVRYTTYFARALAFPRVLHMLHGVSKWVN